MDLKVDHVAAAIFSLIGTVFEYKFTQSNVSVFCIVADCFPSYLDQFLLVIIHDLFYFMDAQPTCYVSRARVNFWVDFLRHWISVVSDNEFANRFAADQAVQVCYFSDSRPEHRLVTWVSQIEVERLIVLPQSIFVIIEWQLGCDFVLPL